MTLNWFSEAESGSIRSASKFCFDLDGRKKFQLFRKFFFRNDFVTTKKISIKIFWKSNSNFLTKNLKKNLKKKMWKNHQKKMINIWKKISDLGIFFFRLLENFKFSNFRLSKNIFKNIVFQIFLFFIEIMLMRSILLSSDPVPLLGTVHLLPVPETKSENPLFRSTRVTFFLY